MSRDVFDEGKSVSVCDYLRIHCLKIVVVPELVLLAYAY
jgi:hypothetical protein